MGRGGPAGARPREFFELGRALGAAVAAVGAVVCGLKGFWLGTVLLAATAACLGPAGPSRGKTRPGDARSNSPDMDRGQACLILGLDPAADRLEIEAAYRRLMRRAHPDQGGTNGLAAQLNAARDVLLRRR